jgi:predicted nucleic acid-binding protein
MVAAVCGWHEHHERAAEALNRRLAGRQTMVVAGHALVEAYAVLTRLPPPHRLSASDALQLIDATFATAGRVVSLDPRTYVGMLRAAPGAGVAGGRIYDAVIAQCAIKGGAAVLLTFNADDFVALAVPDLDIVVP